ncbi:MAG: hypothetical protein ACTSO5_08060 [Candidatus Heimdallarchaeaceae archaeon]
MKKKKTKLSMSLSVFIIGFLISSSSLNTNSTKALVEGENNQFSTDSFDRSDWKWTTTEVVSTESPAQSSRPSLAIDSSGDVHIAWYDLTNYDGAGTDADIFYKHWDASTSSWTITEVVSTESTEHSFEPSLAVDLDGNMHIAWTDYTDYAGSGTDTDIFYKRWETFTSSWTITEVVSTESTADSGSPSLAVDVLGNVYIAWADETDYAGSGTDADIFYKRWDALSSLWTTTNVVSTESTDGSDYPSLAVDTLGNVYIAWLDLTAYAGSGTDHDIFYKHWDTASSIWTTTEVISIVSTYNSYNPSIATDAEGNVHITWDDRTIYAGAGDDFDIFYKRWNTSTSIWTTTEVVSTESTGDSYDTSLAVDTLGNIHIAWYDLTDYAGAGTDMDIFYKRWDTATSLWTTTEVISTESTDHSYNPSLAVDTLGNVHIAWEDNTNYAGAGDNLDIFYKQFAGPLAIPELSFIVPNPTDIETIYLDWNNVFQATLYYVYRSTSYIWSLEGLVPIATVSLSDYVDTLPSGGFYYYVVVAENSAWNSSLSNCQYVEYIADSFDRSDWEWINSKVISTESTDTSNYPSLAVDAFGNVHITWQDITNYAGSGTDLDIFYKRWDATTSTWTTTEVISTESTDGSGDASIAVDTLGNVYIAWHDSTDYAGAGTDWDIFYKRWDASTSLWTTTEVVSTESTSLSSGPSLAIDATGNVHIAWTDLTDYAGAGTDEDIFYKRWEASTSLWTITEVVSTESSDISWWPSLISDPAGNVHIGWYDMTNYAGSGIDADIFYKRWETAISSWTITEVVSTVSSTQSRDPSLASDVSGNVHITWIDYTDYAGSGTDGDVFYKRWDNSTSTWTTTEVVSTESIKGSWSTSIAVDTLGDIHISWTDSTNYNGAGGIDWDIFCKRWEAATSTWINTEVVSTESTEHSTSSSIAVDSTGNVHIAWVDLVDYAGCGTDADIFYKILTGPPPAPELAFIVPNPTELTAINLDWNSLLVATTYYVYRSSSYIWSVEGLVPIAIVSSSDYIDTVPSEGFYYYVVVAENNAGKSSISNGQYIEVKFAVLLAPELAPILPNPTDSDSISLVWDSIDETTEYYIYRSTSYIWSVEGLTPIDTISSTSYIDTLPTEGYYFYVIVANDGVRNSTHSNCEHVEYKVPHLREFSIVSGLILAAFALVFVVTRIRKKNFKLN